MQSANTETTAVTVKQRPDWTALRIEYVNSTLSLRELAAKHSINDAGVMKRAAKEKWEQERQHRSAVVSSVIQEKLTEQYVDKLAEFNAQDIALAETFKRKITAVLAKIDELDAEKPDSAVLNTLANALSTSQKVGRLALGAETSNQKVTGEVTTTTRKEQVHVLLAEVRALAAKQ
jgi:hypothetical protein